MAFNKKICSLCFIELKKSEFVYCKVCKEEQEKKRFEYKKLRNKWFPSDKKGKSAK